MKPKSITSPESRRGLSGKLSYSVPFFRSHLWLITLVALAWMVQACEDGGRIGSSIIADEGQVKADTLLIPSTSEVSAPVFSGNLEYTSAGIYHDALFGEQKATGLIQPGISHENLDTIKQEASAHFELAVDEIYGDLDASAEFTLHDITRRWSASSWRPDSTIVNSLGDELGSATHSGDDETLNIPINDSWLQEFREYFNDGDNEEFQDNMFGLALSAEENSKILSFDLGDSRLVVDNQTDADSVLYTGFRKAAYSLEADRSAGQEREESSLIYNNFENFMKLEFEVDSDFIESSNISRAELVLFKDTDALETTLPDGHRRNNDDVLDFYLLEESDLQLAIDQSPQFQANLDEDDNSFRINLTSFIREQLVSDSEETRKFYVIISENNGKLIQSAIFNHRDESLAPKLLITSVDPD